jgi:ubiquinone/menaquinone biosynthesis C-methylase UbiE
VKRKPEIRRMRSVPPNKKAITLWDQASRWYDTLVGSQGTDFQKDIIMPGVFEMLSPKKGNRILDLACGQGVFSRFLSQKGMYVEGLDSSAELINHAKSRSNAKIHFRVGDVADSINFAKNRFDGMACLMAIQNIENMESLFENAAIGLKPQGHFVVVMTHPCFRRVDHYRTETSVPILTPPFADEDSFTLTYHRPLESYVAALSRAGFAVDGLEEWISNKKSQPGKRAKAENRSRKEIPLFLALRAKLIA